TRCGCSLPDRDPEPPRSRTLRCSTHCFPRLEPAPQHPLHTIDRSVRASGRARAARKRILLGGKSCRTLVGATVAPRLDWWLSQSSNSWLSLGPERTPDQNKQQNWASTRRPAKAEVATCPRSLRDKPQAPRRFRRARSKKSPKACCAT